MVTMFLLGYVVPRFSHVYEDMGGDLPLLSRLLMRWGIADRFQMAASLVGVSV